MLKESINRASGKQHSPELIRARIAVYLLFFANGLGFGSLAPRYPEIVEKLQLTKTAFGQALSANSVGALVAGLAASYLITRFTSARVASFGMVLVGVGLAGAAVANSWLIFAASLALMGGVDAVVDVAQNAHGLRVQRRWGSSIVTSFHAAWSLSVVLGAACSQAVAAAGVDLRVHMGAVILVVVLCAVGPRGWLLSGQDEADRPESEHQVQSAEAGTKVFNAVTVFVLVIMSILCAAAMFSEDMAGNWSALLLRDKGASIGQAGMGVIVLQGTMIVGRLFGDRVIDRFGNRTVLAVGGVLVMVGTGIGLLTGSVPGILAGLVLVGLGCSVSVPVMYSVADDVEGLPPGLGLTVVSWLARVIMLVAPVIVGYYADNYGLWVSLMYGFIGGAILATCWPVVARNK